MKQTRLIAFLLIILLLSLSTVASLWLDNITKTKAIKQVVKHSAVDFANQVQSLNLSVEQVFSRLPIPVDCESRLFESLIYEFIAIKNIGVIKDDVVQCDVYRGSQLNKQVDSYTTFTYEKGQPYKYWIQDHYVTLAAPNGYFIQYDMNDYLNFNLNDDISGFIILGRQSHDLWFDYPQHALEQEAHQLARNAIMTAFEEVNRSNENSPVIQKDHLIYQLMIADNGSVVGVYTDIRYLEKFQSVSLFHLLSGIFFGLLISFVSSWLYLRNRTLKRLLKKAIQRKKLHTVYQPLVDLSSESHEVVGFEALVRWTLPNGDTVSPDVFIPLAEQWGLTHLLTHCIIEKTFHDLHPLLQQNPSLYVSLNITPSDLSDTSLIVCIQAQLSKYKLKPCQVNVELTERIVANENATEGLQAVRKAGFAISIDDFGTGTSNIKYLAELNPDVIKIDRTFVVWSGTQGPTANLLERLIHLGKEFGLKVIVEGIETLEQAKRCAHLGADVGQGFYWFKPLSIQSLIKENIRYKNIHQNHDDEN